MRWGIFAHHHGRSARDTWRVQLITSAHPHRKSVIVHQPNRIKPVIQRMLNSTIPSTCRPKFSCVMKGMLRVQASRPSVGACVVYYRIWLGCRVCASRLSKHRDSNLRRLYNHDPRICISLITTYYKQRIWTPIFLINNNLISPNFKWVSDLFYQPEIVHVP